MQREMFWKMPRSQTEETLQTLNVQLWLQSHTWRKPCILIGLQSEVFSVELKAENEAKWYCVAST